MGVAETLVRQTSQQDSLRQRDGPAVEIAHLRKTYGTLVAVDDVSFSVAEGEIFGILGPNGAGKTTTVECAIGLRSPDSGTIRLMGLDPQADREDLTRSSASSSRRARCRPSSGSARSSTCTGRSTATRPTSAS